MCLLTNGINLNVEILALLFEICPCTGVILSFNTGVSILLGLSVYQMIINAKLPITSDSVPLLGTTITEMLFVQIVPV